MCGRNNIGCPPVPEHGGRRPAFHCSRGVVLSTAPAMTKMKFSSELRAVALTPRPELSEGARTPRCLIPPITRFRQTEHPPRSPSRRSPKAPSRPRARRAAGPLAGQPPRWQRPTAPPSRQPPSRQPPSRQPPSRQPRESRQPCERRQHLGRHGVGPALLRRRTHRRPRLASRPRLLSVTRLPSWPRLRRRIQQRRQRRLRPLAHARPPRPLRRQRRLRPPKLWSRPMLPNPRIWPQLPAPPEATPSLPPTLLRLPHVADAAGPPMERSRRPPALMAPALMAAAMTAARLLPPTSALHRHVHPAGGLPASRRRPNSPTSWSYRRKYSR